MLNIQNIKSHEELMNILENAHLENIKSVDGINKELTQPNILLLDDNLVHNLGIPLISHILKNYPSTFYKVIINCKDSLSYSIFAIENKIPYILVRLKNQNSLQSLEHLAKKHKSIIFSCEEKIFAHFNN